MPYGKYHFPFNDLSNINCKTLIVENPKPYIEKSLSLLFGLIKKNTNPLETA